MRSDVNRQLRLAIRPETTALVTRNTWELCEARVPEPGPGQILVRNMYVSIDPAMRGWIRPTPTYVEPVEVGSVMRAGTVGRVISSKHADFRDGDYVSDVAGNIGFQDYGLSDGAGLLKLDSNAAPLHSYAGGLGLNGFTAYFGLLEVGNPKPGETVLVSSAAGATGSVAGQIARIKGCRVVGIAGGVEKCRLVRESFRFDDVIDYKASKLPEHLSAACPSGVDIFFDNVGGSTLDAALMRLNRFGRIVVCGTISQAGSSAEAVRAHLRLALVHGRMEGFIAYEYAAQFHQALEQLLAWYAQGQLKFQEEIVDGFHSLPACLNRLFTGGNLGKLIIRLDAGL
jgi:NADPH-dependent curcumin reductase CurA